VRAVDHRCWCGWHSNRARKRRSYPSRSPCSRSVRGVKHSVSAAGQRFKGASLSRPRRAASRPGEVLAAGIHGRAFDRTGSRIELPQADFVVGSPVGCSPLFAFLPGVRLCPLADPGFGHVILACQSCFLGLLVTCQACYPDGEFTAVCRHLEQRSINR